MQFFQRFPRISYTMVEGRDNTTQRVSRSVPNMTVKLVMNIFENANLPYLTYRIKGRDRPDTVAPQLYGSSRYAWVILLANSMRDWYDWPLDDREFDAYRARKYESVSGARDGVSVSRSTIRRYIWSTSGGQLLDVDVTYYDTLSDVDRSTETVYTYEYDINDTRRLIRVPTFDALPVVIRQFDSVVS